MSERSSFVTKYIYCPKCFETLKNIFHNQREKYLCATAIPSWENETDFLPILAGKIGGLGPGDDVDNLLNELSAIKNILCHTITIAMIPDALDTKAVIFRVGDGEIESDYWYD